MRLLLVRHGQTPSNLVRALDTAAPGPGLTDLGREQAAELVDALADEQIEAIFCSTLVRTQQTAEPIAAARNLPIVVRDGIREVSAGDFEMSTDEAGIKVYIATTQAWMSGKLDVSIPGSGGDGESTLAAFDEVLLEVEKATTGTALIVSHGAILRLWVASRSTNIDGEYARTHPLGNTGLLIVEGSPNDGWVTVSWEGDPITTGQADPDDPTGGIS